jgi:hypothetical protein
MDKKKELDFTEIDFSTFDYNSDNSLKIEQERAFRDHRINRNLKNKNLKCKRKLENIVDFSRKRTFKIDPSFYILKRKEKFDYLYSLDFLYCLGIGLFSANKVGFAHIPPFFDPLFYINQLQKYFSLNEKVVGFIYGFDHYKNDSVLSDTINHFEEKVKIGLLSSYVVVNREKEPNKSKTDILISNNNEISLIQNNGKVRVINLDDLI